MSRSRPTGGTGDYVEGERVFAPPQGSFDPDWVASLAAERLAQRGSRARLEPAARLAWEALRAGSGPEATEEVLQRRGFSVEELRAVAQAVADFARAYEVR